MFLRLFTLLVLTTAAYQANGFLLENGQFEVHKKRSCFWNYTTASYQYNNAARTIPSNVTADRYFKLGNDYEWTWSLLTAWNPVNLRKVDNRWTQELVFPKKEKWPSAKNQYPRYRIEPHAWSEKGYHTLALTHVLEKAAFFLKTDFQSRGGSQLEEDVRVILKEAIQSKALCSKELFTYKEAYSFVIYELVEKQGYEWKVSWKKPTTTFRSKL